MSISSYRKLLYQPLSLIILATAGYGLFKFAYRFIYHDFSVTLAIVGLLLAPLVFVAAHKLQSLWITVLCIWVWQLAIIALLIDFNVGQTEYHVLAISASSLAFYILGRFFAKLTATQRLLNFFALPLEENQTTQLKWILVWGTTASACLAVFSGLGLALGALGSLVNLVSLAILLLYFTLICRQHRSVLHSYIAMALVPAMSLSYYIYVNTIAWLGSSGGLGRLFHQIYPSLIFCSFSLLFACIALLLRRWSRQLNQHEKLYIEPFAVTSISLGLISLVLTFPVAQGWHVWQSIIIFSVSGLGILLANHIIRIPALSIVALSSLLVAIIQLQGWYFYDSSRLLWWYQPIYLDALSVMAVMALALATLAELLKDKQHWRAIYDVPLRILSATSLAIVLTTIFALPNAGQDFLLPWIFLISTVSLLPLLRPLAFKEHITGVTSLLGLSITAFLLVDIQLNFSASLLDLMPIWAFLLLLVSDAVIPRLNRRFPLYAMAPTSWPYAGLLLMFAGVYQSQWAYLFLLSLYAFIMLRQVSHASMRYLASFLLSLAFFRWAFEYSEIYLGDNFLLNMAGVSTFALICLLSINLLLLLAGLVEKFHEVCEKLFRTSGKSLSQSLYHLSFAYISLTVVAMTWYQLNYSFHLVPIPLYFEPTMVSVFNVILVATSWHLIWRRPSGLNSHLLMTTGLLLIVGLWPLVFNQGSNFAISLTLWAGIILLMLKPGNDVEKYAQFRQTLRRWLYPTSLIGILFNLSFLTQQNHMLAVNLFLQLLLCLAIAWKMREGAWAQISAIIAVLWVHSLVLVWLPADYYAANLASLSLAMSLCTWALYAWFSRCSKSHTFYSEILLALIGFHILALIEWCLHLFYWWDRALLGSPTQGLEYAIALAAIVSLASITLTHAIRQDRGRARRPWIYSTAFQLAFAAVYTRLMILGFTPLGVWDTASLMIAAYLCLLLMSFVRSKALYRMASLFPLLAVATVPFQLGSVHASLTLMLAGVLYLGLHKGKGPKWQYYAGLLAINGAVYLWIPNWANQTQLLQLYLVPAALSVLILAHLHRSELKTHVLNSLRLGATSVLYAAATLDVFLTENLLIFVLALFISLLGIILGIALRIRAFLYSGLAFLILNVLGRLIQFYPQQALGQAITLMALGAIITFGMIWFNLKREEILQRVGALRATLSTWE